ncbi:hypothetical protein RHMOL_Rhmol04G0009200 [Rhododendron molle]|uniref:Uncharacterized protein n=1 Tax=Rhododendron molle TaxID=49168 RepID=A0ACC0NWR8_RHOML|nr:hypothetical protein RHMOL_Rhmol04G0009200 [Rhododendron molle]
MSISTSFRLFFYTKFPQSLLSLQQPISEFPPKLQEIVKLFQAVQQPKAKYEQLLFYGKNLKALDSQFKTILNRVQCCVSQIWVRAYLYSVRNVLFQADSDSVLTKGLAALLVRGLSGLPVEEIIRVSPDENPVQDLDSGSKVGIGIGFGDLKLGKSEVAADDSDVGE